MAYNHANGKIPQFDAFHG